MQARLSHRPTAVFLAAALLVVAVEAFVAQSAGLRAHPDLLGVAVAVDLVVGIPLIWGWLMVRRGPAPAITLVPVTVAAWLAAKALLPAAAEGGLRAAAELAPLLEVGVVLYVAVRVRRVARAYRSSDAFDPVLRMREALASVLGSRTPARLVADEVSMLRYLVRPPVGEPGPGARTFSYHRRSGWGALVFALSLVVAAETVAVHALLSRWSVAAAWVLTALSVYSLLWLVADWRAARTRPLVVHGGELLVRVGLRWTGRVPRGAVADVQRPGVGERLDGDGELSMSMLAPPSLVVELSRPVRFDGPFGIDRDVRRLGLVADDPDALRSALAEDARPLRRGDTGP